MKCAAFPDLQPTTIRCSKLTGARPSRRRATVLLDHSVICHLGCVAPTLASPPPSYPLCVNALQQEKQATPLSGPAPPLSRYACVNEDQADPLSFAQKNASWPFSVDA